MENQMLHVKLIQRKRNECMGNKTKVRDRREDFAKLKFAGQNTIQKVDRFNNVIIKRKLRKYRRNTEEMGK